VTHMSQAGRVYHNASHARAAPECGVREFRFCRPHGESFPALLNVQRTYFLGWMHVRLPATRVRCRK
jgi:hypothetical protein